MTVRQCRLPPNWTVTSKLPRLVKATPDETVDLALPHTVGLWGATEPVEVELVGGRNVLRFAHERLSGS